jgi:hypothetical protein
MIIAVQGSKTFDNYDTFMRAMGVAMSGLKDKNVEVWSVGPYRVNSFTAAFCNSGENFLKSQGISIRFSKVAAKFIERNLNKIDYFAYVCNPHEGISSLTAQADLANIEVGVFRY